MPQFCSDKLPGKPSSLMSVYRRNLPVNVWEYINHLSDSSLQYQRLRHHILIGWQKHRQQLDWHDDRIQPPTLTDRIRIETFQKVKMILVSEHVCPLSFKYPKFFSFLLAKSPDEKVITAVGYAHRGLGCCT